MKLSRSTQPFSGITLALALASLALMGEHTFAADTAKSQPATPEQNKACADCHRKTNPAMVMEWERSKHFRNQVGCLDCHGSESGLPGAWRHEGAWVSVLVTPKDCGQCHTPEVEQFSRSHHAKAGEILASLDNVLAEKVAGMPGNIADAVNGCWQCHGTIVKFQRDAQGAVVRTGKEGKPVLDA